MADVTLCGSIYPPLSLAQLKARADKRTCMSIRSHTRLRISDGFDVLCTQEAIPGRGARTRQQQHGRLRPRHGGGGGSGGDVDGVLEGSADAVVLCTMSISVFIQARIAHGETKCQ